MKSAFLIFFSLFFFIQHIDILSSWVIEFPPEGRWTKGGWRTEKKDRKVFKVNDSVASHSMPH